MRNTALKIIRSAGLNKLVLAALVSVSQLVFAAPDQFSIESQPLGAALKAFADQTKIQLLYSDQDVNQIIAPNLAGEFSREDALRHLLKNSDLQHQFTSDNMVIIKPRDSVSKKLGKTLLASNETQSAQAGTSAEGVAGSQSDAGSDSRYAIDEIVVTASKRETSLQDTAMSVTALSSDEIKRRRLVSMHDYLSSIPSVTFIDSGPGQNQIIIRGIGLSQFEQATVSSYFGEVPLTPSIGGGGFAQLGGSSTDMKMVDLERVEVLKGPQGTLYGSGAMGGTVRNIPKSPVLDEFEGQVDFGYGVTAHSDDNNNKMVGVFNIPLVDDSLAMRVAAYRFDNAGFIDRVSEPNIQALSVATGLPVDLSKDLGGHTYTGGRASLLWKANDNLELNLMLATQKLEEDGNGSVEIGLGGYRSAVLDPSGVPEFNKDEFDIANLVLEYSFGWATFLATYSHFEGNAKSQFTAADSFLAGTVRSYNSDKDGDTVELRLASNLDGSWQFVAGLYYEDFELRGNQFGEWTGDPAMSPVPPIPATTGPNGFPVTYFFPIDFQQSLEHKALFGEITYALNTQWAITAGGRWFDYDRRDNNFGSDFFGPFGQSDLSTSEKDANYKLNIAYTPNDESLLYIQWSEGFRLGSGQVLPPASICDIDNDGKLDFTNGSLDPSVESDTTTNYELGGKFNLIDKRLTLNVTLYRIDWENIPVNVFDTSDVCPGNLAVIDNFGEARSEGVELETRYFATPNLQLSLSASYMDTEILTDNLGPQGGRLPLAPRFNGIVGMQYDFEWQGHTAFLRSDYSYIGDFISDALFPLPDAEAHGKWNIRAGIAINQWTLEVYANNLTNEDALTIGQDVTAGRRVIPRIIGFEAGYQF